MSVLRFTGDLPTSNLERLAGQVSFQSTWMKDTKKYTRGRHAFIDALVMDRLAAFLDAS